MVLPFLAPLGRVSGIAGPEEAKNLGGARGLRLIQIRLATSIFEKFDATCQGKAMLLRNCNVLAFAESNRFPSPVAVIRVYDDAGNVIETDEHKGDFKEW